MASSTGTRGRSSTGKGSGKGTGKGSSAAPSTGGRASKGTKGATKAGSRGAAAGRGSAARSGPKKAAGGGAKGAGRAGSPGGAGGGTPGTGKVRGAFREHLGERRRDIGGLALIVLGVLAGLGTYADAAGPVGEFLEAVALGLFGLVGYATPVLLTWFGLLVVIGRPGPEVGRIAVGSVVLLLGVLGGLHLLAGTPDPGDGMRALWRAGGLLGWGVATPLAWALSAWGAGAVLLAVVLLGILIVTRTPFSRVVELLRGALIPRRRPEGDDEVADPDATQPLRGRAQRAAARSAGDGDQPAADQQEPSPTRVRATLAGTSATQPPLSEGLVDDPTGVAGATAGGEAEVAGVPDPPVERARVPAAPTGKARKVRPVESFADYQLPSLDLLAAGRAVGKESRRVIDAQAAALQETFDQFGVDATVARHSRGPTVTRFEIELGPGVQVKKVANMGDDIAYALAA